LPDRLEILWASRPEEIHTKHCENRQHGCVQEHRAHNRAYGSGERDDEPAQRRNPPKRTQYSEHPKDASSFYKIHLLRAQRDQTEDHAREIEQAPSVSEEFQQQTP
jgi:hypothetical protein